MEGSSGTSSWALKEAKSSAVDVCKDKNWMSGDSDWPCKEVAYVFIITDKTKVVGEEAKSVGVMKDEELKFEEIEVSHTLGG